MRDRLKEIAYRRRAVAFGVASADAVDALPRIKIGWTINRYNVPLRDTMPEARVAIVFGVPSVDDADELEVRRGEGEFSYPGYLPIQLIEKDLVHELRSLGFRACPASFYASEKRMAMMAGIGSYGKNALIISPRHGPWLRFGEVLTDAPLEPDKPLEEDLCGRCTRCVRACPAKALTPYVVNPSKCLVAVSELSRHTPEQNRMLNRFAPLITPKARVMCRTCQLVCPYTSAERRRNTFGAQTRGRR